jgi:transposase InsO family protein
VWSYDSVQYRTRDGKAIRFLVIIDEHTRECLALRAARRITAEDVLTCLDDLFNRRGVPDHIRSDNGPEFTATPVRDWLKTLDIKPLYIEPGSPWKNGYVESFNGKLPDEMLNGEIFDTFRSAQLQILPALSVKPILRKEAVEVKHDRLTEVGTKWASAPKTRAGKGGKNQPNPLKSLITPGGTRTHDLRIGNPKT